MRINFRSRLAAPILLVVGACATMAPNVSSDATLVVEAPREEVEPAAAFERMVLVYVATRKSAIDECYLSEVLSGQGGAPASYQFAVRARPGTRVPLVDTISTTNRDQRILEHCVKAALTGARFSRPDVHRHVVEVRVNAPDWVASR